jgi:hypothetical protein
VALLFLVDADIATEPVWAAFIAAAAELALRRGVSPTRPAPPRLFPDIPQHTSELNTQCWAHGGPLVKIQLTPRRTDGPGA